MVSNFAYIKCFETANAMHTYQNVILNVIEKLKMINFSYITYPYLLVVFLEFWSRLQVILSSVAQLSLVILAQMEF